MNITLNHQVVGLILLQQSKQMGLSFDDTVLHFLKAGLNAERDRLIAERKKTEPPPEPLTVRIGGGTITYNKPPNEVDANSTDTPKGYIITDPCSEKSLRGVCGDEWKLCWWLATCSLSQIGGGG